MTWAAPFDQSPPPAGGRERQADARQDGRVADDVARCQMAEEPGLAPADERGVQAEALEMAEGRLDGAPRLEGPLDEPADEERP